MVLVEEVQELVKKLEKLQRSSGIRGFIGRSYSNIDKQASLLQRRLERFGATSDDICVKEIQEMAVASLSMRTSCRGDETFVSSGKCNVRMKIISQLFYGARLLIQILLLFDCPKRKIEKKLIISNHHFCAVMVSEREKLSGVEFFCGLEDYLMEYLRSTVSK